MGVTRRRFLGYAAGAVTMGLPFDLWRPGRSSLAAEGEATTSWLTLDATTRRPVRLGFSDTPGVTRADGGLALNPARVAVSDSLQAGASVILESGAGFASAREFRAHRVVLRDYLQVQIEAPVQLWSGHTGSQGIPYVDYTWPCAAKVRDFSYVVPLARQPGEVIAWVNGLPVALKRQSGRGTLIFLGSPLGPALWAGDAEARRWLLDVAGPTVL